MKTSLLSQTGKKIGVVDLPPKLFAASVNRPLLAQAVRVHQANRRQGTAAVKSRGEVRGSGRKIWKQKGSGRARHGDRYAPIFVGGGRAHGPRPKDWSMALPRKMRRRALTSALSLKLKEKSLLVVEKPQLPKAKTREFVGFLNAVLPGRKGRVLLVLPQADEKVYRAARNVPGLTVVPAYQLDVLLVLNHRWLIIVKEAVAGLGERLLGLTPRKQTLAELDLPPRIVSLLEGAGVNSVADLQGQSEADLRQIKGIGPKAAAQILAKIK